MYSIGIDIGSTITKIIQMENDKIINKQIYDTNDIYEIIYLFTRQNCIKIDEIKEIVLTGIGTLNIRENVYNIPTKIVNEFEAISNCIEKECLITSIGTGTAFLLKENGKITHLGGSGLGGGTLINLSKKLTEVSDFSQIKSILEKGDLNNIDLRLKDISQKKFSNLNFDTTISNFGKIEKNASSADIVLGILNMIVESIAVMAAIALKNTKIKDVIVIGTIASLPQIRNIFSRVSKLHDVNFQILENPEFATITGAMKEY